MEILWVKGTCLRLTGEGLGEDGEQRTGGEVGLIYSG